MLHDTIGFVELTELPVTAVEGTILFLEKDTPTLPRGHYQFTDGEWHPIASSEGGSVTNISSLVPTFRPAVGTIIANQLDQRDRLVADGSSHPSEKWPALAALINTGLPLVAKKDFVLPFGPTSVTRNFGNSQIVLAEYEGAPHILEVDRPTLDVVAAYPIESIYNGGLVTDGEVILYRTKLRRWAMLDRTDGSSEDLGTYLEDMHESDEAPSGSITSVATVNGVSYVGLMTGGTSSEFPEALVLLDPNTKQFSDTKYSVGGDITNMEAVGSIIYVVGHTTSNEAFLKIFDPDGGTVTDVSSTVDARLLGSERKLAKDSTYLYLLASGSLARLPLDGENAKWEYFPTGTADSVFTTENYVVLSRSASTSFYDKKTMELVQTYGQDEISYYREKLSPSESLGGIFIPSERDTSVNFLFTFESFSVPQIEDRYEGAPVLIQAR